MRPIIGIICRSGMRNIPDRPPIFYTNKPYVQAVEDAGGLPILLPVYHETYDMATVFARLDGILLAGGIDVDPDAYHETVQAQLSETDRRMDHLEIGAVHWALRKNVPLLGICRGLQILNVALGGTLYQDLDSQYPDCLEHSSWHVPRDHLIHTVNLEPASTFARILDTTKIAVNSLHHQAIKELGSNLVITGRAPDNVIEMVEVPDHRFMLATQCHPEELYKAHPAWLTLFQTFIEACQHDD